MDEIIVIEGNIDDDGFYSAKNFKEESGPGMQNHPTQGSPHPWVG